MHGPEGKDYPNESRFIRISSDELCEIERFSGHHFVLSISLQPSDGGTRVFCQKSFDTLEHYEGIAHFIAEANAQNVQRLATEVLRSLNTA